MIKKIVPKDYKEAVPEDNKEIISENTELPENKEAVPIPENNNGSLTLPKSSEPEPKPKPVLEPGKFIDFRYSKKSHFDFFRKNNFDIELFDRSVKAEDCGINDYQMLLIYSFIRKNIRPGSRILQIGNQTDLLLEKLKYDYDCWIMSDAGSLASTDRTNIDIHNYRNRKIKYNCQPDFFDFVFSISAFRHTPAGEKTYNAIFFNLDYFTKPSGLFLHNFVLEIHPKYNKINPILFYLFDNTYRLYRKLNHYYEHRSIPYDPDYCYFITETKIFNDSQKPAAGEVNTKLVSYNTLQRKTVRALLPSSETKSSFYLKKSPAFIFHHIIKCGGTSALKALGKWFNMEPDYLVNDDHKNNYLKFRYYLENITADTCVVGHYNYEGMFLHQRYPEVTSGHSEIKTFTFVRDPLKFSTSFYYYTKFHGRFDNIKLINHLRFNFNYLASFIPCDESNYKEVIDRYFFVGITERMQESFDKLAKVLNKRRIIVPRDNVSEKDEQVNEITPEFIEEFKELNKLDYMIYNYCLEKFNNT